MENHEELLDKWNMEPGHFGEAFIRDGVIDPVCWASSSRKVLLLLKEAYTDQGSKEGYDLCKWIREEWGGTESNMWPRVARWCHMVHSLEKPKSYEKISDKEAKDALLSSAVINIKKSNGRSFSEEENIKDYATKDKEYIKKQIVLINPQIVICGYTWPFVKDFWVDWQSVSDLVYFADGRIFVDYWHPANRYPHKLNYYTLAFLLQQAQREKPQLFARLFNGEYGGVKND